MRHTIMRQFTVACLALGLAVFLGSIAVSILNWNGTAAALGAPAATATMIITLALQLAFVLLQLVPEGRQLVNVRFFGPDAWLSIISFTLMPGVAWHTLGEIAKILERRYDVKINIDNQELQNIRYSGSFKSVPDIDKVLHIIKQNTPISYTVDGQNVLEVNRYVSEARERALAGQGPTFINAVTYRYNGHNVGEKGNYRSLEEISDWRSHRDPITQFVSLLIDSGQLTQEEYVAMGESVKEEISNAVAFAEHSPEPDISTLMDNVDSGKLGVLI